MSNTASLKKEYAERIAPALKSQFQYSSTMQVPVLKKIVINQGLGMAVADKKIIEVAINEMTAITGQKAVATISRKDIANFKLRKKMPIGVMVTLRRERMYEFLEKLVRVALPRIRDFKGIESKFDGKGNYTLEKRLIDMAKESMKAREVKRAKLVAKYAERRAALKQIVRTGDPADAFEAAQKLQELPKNSNPIRMHNRCKLTGRPKGYIRQFGISRIQFREMASNGLIPGVKKASW